MIFVFSPKFSQALLPTVTPTLSPGYHGQTNSSMRPDHLAAAEYKLFLAIIFHRFVIHP